MEKVQDNDLIRIKELLKRTGEFIAYFELAETKMIEWRQEIELQTSNIQHQINHFKTELESFNHLISETGVANFRATAEQALGQGEANLKCLERSCAQFNKELQKNQEKITSLTYDSLERIDKYTTQATQSIITQLTKYDPQHFNRIATESCDHVEQAARDSIAKSNKLLHLFHFRVGLFSVILTIITAFIIVLYTSDEYPWEIHSQAMNERQAGKVLLEAWPNLTQSEKEKILNRESKRHG